MTVRSIRESLESSGYFRLALIIGLAILLAGLPVPIPLRALVEVAIMAAATVVTALGLARHSRMQVARIAFLLMLALYTVLLANSNVPDPSTGMQGIRYTMVAISGLMLGLGLPDREGDRAGLIEVVSLLLLAGALASLAVHAFAPGYEESLKRSADATTATLGGVMRMQGLLSGPFHVSMLGSFLALAGAWILALGRRRVALAAVGAIFLATGVALLGLARVRTGMLVTALGLLLLLIVGIHQGPGFRGAIRSLKPEQARSWAFVSAGLIAFAGLGFLASQNVAVQKIGDLPNDHRVDSRLDAIGNSADLALDSPLSGWGPGSASSGLRQDFVDAGKLHETPHNGALGLLIEGGIGALACFLVIFGTAIVNLVRQIGQGRQRAKTGIAIASIVPVLGFWVVGDALAALPISLCLCLVTGVYLANGINLERQAEATDG